MTINECAALLSALDDVYLLTHERPDGDTLGSAVALCLGLRVLGKTAYVLPNPDLTPRLGCFAQSCISPSDSAPEGSALVAVDTATPERLPLPQRGLAAEVLLSIDHHPGEAWPGVETCVLTGCASTGEIIYGILREMSVRITPQIALPLYLAMATDTGCFRYSNTTPATHRITADLLDTGIDVTQLHREFFDTKSLPRFRIEGMMLDRAEFLHGGKVAICPLTLEMQKLAGANEDDIDNIASLPRQISGVLIGAVVKELGEELCKISVRTAKPFMANLICAKLGGGGHVRAAGCEVALPLTAARRSIISAISKELQ